MQRGGLGLNAEGLSWILLNALRLSPEAWDRLLFWNDNHLPRNEDEFNQPLERIRRAWRVREGMHHGGGMQGGAGDLGQYYFPVVSGDGVSADVPQHEMPAEAR